METSDPTTWNYCNHCSYIIIIRISCATVTQLLEVSITLYATVTQLLEVSMSL